MKELPTPNLDITELVSTLGFIADCEADGVDCTALREYIKPITKRVNLEYIKPINIVIHTDR